MGRDRQNVVCRAGTGEQQPRCRQKVMMLSATLSMEVWFIAPPSRSCIHGEGGAYGDPSCIRANVAGLHLAQDDHARVRRPAPFTAPSTMPTSTPFQRMVREPSTMGSTMPLRRPHHVVFVHDSRVEAADLVAMRAEVRAATDRYHAQNSPVEPGEHRDTR